MLKIFIALLSVCLLPAAGWAETIYLKNGEVIKAKITKDTGYSIQIMAGGFPKSFRMDEVDRVEPDEPPAPAPGAEAAAEELTAEKKELITRLIEANGARESMIQSFAQIIDSIPADAKAKYQAMFKVDEIISRLLPVYARHYTTQELKEIIMFYKSPVGQKHIQTTPEVMKETMVETIKYFQEKMPPQGLPGQQSNFPN